MKDNKLKIIGIHFGFWIAFIGFLALILSLQHKGMPHSLFNRLLIGIGLFYINYLVLAPYLLLRRHIALYSLLSLFFIFLAIFFIPIWKGHLLLHLKRGRYFFSIFIYLFFFVTALALVIYEKWRTHEKREREIKAEHTMAELHNLKNQINPHFLFNSLNSIYALTVKKSEQAPEAVITLSELMRYMLYQTSSRFVPLKNEIAYMQNYIELQKLRIADKENISFNTSGKVKNQHITPLLLIAFVENAFKFGTDSQGNTSIIIQLNIEETQLHFSCKNSKSNQPKEDENSGFGLKNAKEQLRLIYPQNHRLEIKETETTFRVDLYMNLSNEQSELI